MVDWNYWNPFKPWARPKAEVIRILEGVLDGTLDCREWDNFINIPMKGTPELEAVRLACEALQVEESMDAKGVIIHTPKAREQLESLLRSIKE